MIRTKRALAFILAAVMTFTTVIPSYAEENLYSDSTDIVEESLYDVTENDTEPVISVSENEQEESEEISDISGTDIPEEQDESVAIKHTPTLDIADYVWMLGGLDTVYEEQTGEGLLDNRYDSDGKTEDLQGAYEAVTEAMANRQEEVNLSSFNIRSDGTAKGEEKLFSVVATVLNDNSKFGYFSGISSYTTDEDDIVEEIIFDYDNNFDADVYETALRKAYDEAITDDKESDLIKAMELHNWLVQHVVYDMNFSNPNRYSGYGAIVDRKCVCMGYSIAYGDLLQLAGIKHGYVTSYQMNHMWNVVQLDGKWYHVDCTWDDPSDYALGRGRFYTFLVSTSLIKKREHNYNDWQIRVSDSYNYFDGLTSVSCTSTKYDSYWWQSVSSMMVYYDGYFYYQTNTWSPKEYIYKVKANDSTGAATTVVETGYRGSYANVSASNGYLVYKDGDKKISRLRFGETEPVTVYKLDDSDSTNHIFETLACGEYLYVNQGSDINHAKIKPVLLFQISNADISASSKSLTYGSGKTIDLTGSFRRQKSGEVSVNWYMLKPGDTEYNPIRSITIPKGNSKKTDSYIFSAFDEDGNPRPAGTYKIKFSAELGGDETSKVISITINKAALSVKNKNYDLSVPYDAAQIEAPATANFETNASLLNFAWYKSSTITDANKLASAPINAGTYYLVASFGGDTNIKSGSVTFPVTIEKRALSIVIDDQTILWDDTIASNLGSIDSAVGFQGTDHITAVVLKQSTTEPTDEGTISCSSITLRNSDGVKVNNNYSISYALGKLVIEKRDVVIKAKNQNLFVGDTVFDEVKNVVISGDDFDTDRYVITSVKLSSDRTDAGVGTIIPTSVKIMRVGTNTDVTRYFNQGFVAGTLAISKKSVSNTTVTKEFWHQNGDGEFEYSVNVKALAGLSSDASNVAIQVTSNPSSGNVSEVTNPENGIVTIKGNASAGKETVTYKYKVTSDNYADVTVNVVCHFNQTGVSVVFHAGEGLFEDGSNEMEVVLSEGEPLPEDIVSRLWYNFDGWYTLAEGGAKKTSASTGDVWAHWSEKYTVSAVEADIPSGTEVEKGTRVSLTTDTLGAKIYYTINGTTPDVTDNNLYKEAVVITGSTTIKAIAVKDNWGDSSLFSATYTVAEDGWGDLSETDKALYAFPSDIPEGIWYAGVTTKTYTGKAILQDNLRVYDKNKLLVKDKDYTLTYSDNKKAGTATIKIKGKGNYKETAKATFEIVPLNIGSSTQISASINAVKAKSTYQKPDPAVKFGSTTLKRDTDYKVTYRLEGTENIVSKIKSAGNYTVFIEGIGNYTGTKEISLTVTSKTLISETSIGGISSSYNYTGTAIKPSVKIKYGNKELKGAEIGTADASLATTDYIYEYRNNIEKGTASVIITGAENNTDKGSFFGTKTVTFKIKAPRSIADTKIVFTEKSYICTGSPVIPTFTLEYTKSSTDKVLAKDTDFTYTITDNILPGKIKVKCVGIGKYSGTKTFTVTLSAKSISKATVNGVVSSVVYTGSPITQTTTLILDGATLTKDVDYTVSYKSNIKAGTATIIYTGINKYTGSVKKDFTITKYNLLTGADVYSTVDVDYNHTVAYQKGETRPSVTVTFKGNLLKAGTDYTIKYTNNTTVGSTTKKPAITITGKGNFTGTITRNFVITKADISTATVSVGDVTYSATPGAKPKISVSDVNGTGLKSGTDFDKKISFTYAYDTYVISNGATVGRRSGEIVGAKDIIPAGTRIKVTVKGKGNYTGTIDAYYSVITKSLSDAKITVKSQNYTGSPVTLSKDQIAVKISGKKLDATDYDIVAYSNNTKVGTATVTIRAKGNYGGTKTVKFKITARKIRWFN